MAHDRDSQAGAVMMAFIVGAIAGAAVALLWAPASGAETRRKLGDALDQGSEKGREYLKKAGERSKDAFEKGKEAFDQARAAKEKA